MNINLEMFPIDRVYRAQVCLASRFGITPEEAARLDQFGPLLIDIGSAIVAADTTTVATLPTSQIAVPIDLPVSKDFSLDDYTGNNGTHTADVVAAAWLFQMETRINTALVALLAMARTQPSSRTVTLPLS
jgi:hypothetical protein